MMAVSSLRDILLAPRARTGQRSNLSPLQREIRNLDRIWGRQLVDAMLRVAQARAMGEHDVATARIVEMAGAPQGARKRTEAVRRGSDQLLKIARASARKNAKSLEETSA